MAVQAHSTSIRRHPVVFWAGLFVASLGACLMYLAAIANGPDVELSFSRDVPSARSPGELGHDLDDVGAWPKWFFSTADAVIVDPHGQPLAGARLEPGAYVRLGIEPKGLKWRRFEVVVQCIRYTPGRSVGLRVITDSKNALTRIFDDLEWNVEIRDGSVHGFATARTRNWKSRLFGRIATRVLMNQAFFPDLIRLAHGGETDAPSLFSGDGA